MTRSIRLALLLLLSLNVAGCEIIEGIFKVGVWVGIIVVLALILLVWILVKAIR